MKIIPSSVNKPVEPGDLRFMLKSRDDIHLGITLVVGVKDLGPSDPGHVLRCFVLTSTGNVLHGTWIRGPSSEALFDSDLVLSETCY